MSIFINGYKASLAQAEFEKFHGNSVFTTLRSRNKKPCHFDMHWERLSVHTKHFSYALPDELAVYSLICDALSEREIDQKIRIIIKANNYVVTIEDLISLDPNIYQGVSIIISKQMVHPQLAIFKTGNSLPYFLAAREAKAFNAFEALLCDAYGHVVDGSRTGLMLLNDDEIISLSGGLDSIMRKLAINIAKDMGLKHRVALLQPKQIYGQLFLTNCILGVVPVGYPGTTAAKELIMRCKDL